MLIGEPPPTQADLQFRLFGIPVRVHPFFWIVALLLGMRGDEVDPVEMLLWVGVVFVSILVHELGHAFLQRRYGGHPWITLYGMGGLASCDDCDRSPRAQILISLAGPVAGFLLAALLVLAIRLSGHQIGFATSVDRIDLAELGLERVRILPLLITTAYLEPLASPQTELFVVYMLWVNIFWGLINLLPIYPLDGGRIAREVFTLGGNPRRGIERSLWLSIAAAIFVAILGLRVELFFMALLFGYLAYTNYQALRAYQDR